MRAGGRGVFLELPHTLQSKMTQPSATLVPTPLLDMSQLEGVYRTSVFSSRSLSILLAQHKDYQFSQQEANECKSTPIIVDAINQCLSVAIIESTAIGKSVWGPKYPICLLTIPPACGL